MSQTQRAVIALFACLVVWIAYYDRSSSQRPPNYSAVNNGRSNEAQQEAAAAPTEDLIFGYPALDVFTGVLAFATIGLGVISICGIRNQSRETRIIQRAYVSADPRGIEPLENQTGGHADGHVGFHNVGRLPAKNVRWFIRLTISPDVQLNNFPAGEYVGGTNVIPPGTEMRQWGRTNVEPSDFVSFRRHAHFVYVWGEVRYDDGFGTERFTKFCHRYERRGFREPPPRIDHGQGGAVYHQHGNDAD
jgi:hypothetical protein